MRRLFAAAAVVLLIWVAHFAWDYFDYRSVAHQSMQIQLKLFGSAM